VYLHGFSNPFHALQVFSDASDVLSRYTHVYSSCNYYSNYIKYNFYLCKRKYKMNRRLTKIFTGFLEVSWGCLGVSKRALRVLQVVLRYLVKYCHKCTCSSRYLGCLGGPLRVFRSILETPWGCLESSLVCLWIPVGNCHKRTCSGGYLGYFECLECPRVSQGIWGSHKVSLGRNGFS